MVLFIFYSLGKLPLLSLFLCKELVVIEFSPIFNFIELDSISYSGDSFPLLDCWLWSLIIFLIQRSLFSVVLIPHEVFTP
jgi:hypothetical protein